MSQKFSEGKDYKVLAVCIPQFNEQRQSELLKELINQGISRKYKLMIFSSLCNFYEYNIEQIGEEQIYYVFDPARFDAVVIFSDLFKIIDIPKKIALRARQVGVPVLSVGSLVEGCVNLCVKSGTAFKSIVQHVVEHHQVTRVNFIAGVKNEFNSEERLKAFRQVMEENHLDVPEQRIGYGEYWEKPTEDVMDRFWNSELEFPQAIICANDKMAMTVCHYLQQKGKRVPEDVIVTGYDGIELERYFKPRLTTAECSDEVLIGKLFEMHKKIELKELPMQGDYYLEPVMRVGESCGCKKNEQDAAMQKIMELTWNNDCMKTFYSEEIQRMVPRLSEDDDIRTMFEKLGGIVDRMGMHDFYYAINSDMLDERYDMSVRIFESNSTYRWEPYTDTMFVPFGKAGDNRFFAKKVALSDLLPDIDQILEREEAITFIPSHIQGQTLGYTAFTWIEAEQPYTRANLFVGNLLYVMEIYRRRAEQDNLYLRDSLTQLYNRFGFYQNVIPLMKQCKEQNKLLNIISVDLDNLKEINDHFGHQEGDNALQTISQLLLGFSRFGEVCSRFGGDEFIIAFGSAEQEHRAEEICEQCENILQQYSEDNDKPYRMNASFGIARGHVGDSKELAKLIDQADQRMYDEKHKHKEEVKRQQGG